MPDLLIALAVALLVALEVFSSDLGTPLALAVPCTLVPAAALAFRRRAPLASAAVVMVPLVVMGVADDSRLAPQTPLVLIALAAVSVAAHGSPRERWAGLVVVLAGVLAIEPGDVIVQWPLVAAVWAGGLLASRYREQSARLEELTAVLEGERAEHARMAIVEERARIARELHDVVAHGVSTMIVQAGAERLALGPDAPASTRETLSGIEDTGREALVELRRLLGVLRTDADGLELAPQPRVAELPALAERVTRAGLPVALETEGRPTPLPPGVDVSAYRIVQEALTNALKHSGAHAARVVVRYGGPALEVEVSDDGRGTGAATLPGGHGLAGLRERVTILGGELTAGAVPEGGWRLVARLPLAEPA